MIMILVVMLDQAEIDEKLAAGVPYVIRQTIPDKGKATLMMKSMVILK